MLTHSIEAGVLPGLPLASGSTAADGGSTRTADRPAGAARQRPHAVVIGSGFGGLAAAIRLGARGWRVTVLERLGEPGGRAGVHQQDGFTFDAGPTVITAPFLLEELWSLAGRRLADDITLVPVKPFYQVRFDNGETFDYCGDAAAMRDEVSRFAPGDVAGYERFLSASEAIYRVGFERLGHVPFAHFSDMLRVLPDLLRLESWRTVWQLACKHVADPRLRVVLTFQSLLVGGNPFATTSVYCLIAYLERRFGVHWAIGGTNRLVAGMAGLIAAQGNELRCNAGVSRILVKDGAACGVVLDNGDRLAADAVVSNADSANTYRLLVAPEHRKRWTDRRIARAKYSMSLFVWYFGTRRQYPGVAHHTIALGPRYRDLLTDIFDRKHLADDFSLYVHRPTATDPSMAPPGCDTFYALAPVPHLQSGTDWTTGAEPFRQRVMRRLEQTLLPGLSDAVVCSRVLTPLDFQDRLSSFRGAAFGLAPVLSQSAWFRPHNASEDVARLYLVGAGTHPGAGLPGVLSSARILDTVVPHGDEIHVTALPEQRASSVAAAVLAAAPRTAGRAAQDAAQIAAQEADLAACRAKLVHGSRTFLAASWLLPRAVRDPACALYAFCRQADDEVDGQCGGHTPAGAQPMAAGAAGAAVHQLQQRLAALYAGRPAAHAADRALAAVVRQHRIPKHLLDALLEGFAWDAQGRCYETFDELLAYAARVAGTVGAMMALLMGERSATALARACDLGVAMQLSNIARDVGEDARSGRLYLPRQWLLEAGIDADAWLAAPRHSPALAGVVQRLLREADRLYAQVDAGVAALPLSCRPGINAARFLYAQIGLEVERQGLNAVDARVSLPRRHKAWGLVRALLVLRPSRRHAGLPPLDATRALVEAVTGPLPATASAVPASDQAARRRRPAEAAATHSGLDQVLALFERLERRDRALQLANR